MGELLSVSVCLFAVSVPLYEDGLLLTLECDTNMKKVTILILAFIFLIKKTKATTTTTTTKPVRAP